MWQSFLIDLVGFVVCTALQVALVDTKKEKEHSD